MINLVDSSGWIAHFRDEPNASAFGRIIADAGALLVPTVVLYEVARYLGTWVSEEAAQLAASAMQEAAIAELSSAIALAGAHLARQHKLSMADSIIFATAQAYGATIWTQDADFRDLPGVRFLAPR